MATSSDGFAVTGNDLAGPALTGVAAAWNLLIHSNASIGYWSKAGTGGPNVAGTGYPYPRDSIYAEAVAANWLLNATTNNVATLKRGLTTGRYIKLPWAGYVSETPSGDQLTNTAGAYSLRTSGGDNLAFRAADGQIATLTSRTGLQTTFTYSPSGTTPSQNWLSRVAVGSHSLNFTYSGGKLTSIADESGSRQAVLAYYANSLVKAYLPDHIGGVVPSLQFGFKSCHSGPFNGLMNSVTQLMSLTETTSVSLDPDSCLVTGITNANNHPKTYDAAPGRFEVFDPATQTSSYQISYPAVFFGDWINTDSFDALGNKTSVSANYAGQVVSKTLPDTQPNYNSVYTYDAHGNLASTSIGIGSGQIQTSAVYDQTWNKPTSATDALQRTTTYTLDGSGNVRKVVHPSALMSNGQILSPQETYTYNAAGQVLTATDADSTQTAYSYDTGATWNLLSVTVDATNLKLVTTFGYDAVGNVNSVTNADQKTSTSKYDLCRRLKQTTTPSIYAAGKSYNNYYYYDLAGNLTSTTQDAPNGQQLKTTITYDGIGNVLTKSVPSVASSAPVTTNTYDTDDRLSTIIDPAGQKVTRLYFANGALQSVLNTAGSATQTYTYTGDGLVKTLTDGNGNVTQYTYDAYDRLTRTTYSDGSYEQVTLDNGSRATVSRTRAGITTSTNYDNLDRVTSQTDPDASTPITFSYDQVGLVQSVANSAGAFAYQYDTAERQIQTTRPDGLVLRYGYDALGRTSTITYPDGAYVYTYTYDEISRMRSVRETSPAYTAPMTNLAVYDYNELSQRIDIKLGNLTSATYSYDAANGLKSIAQIFQPPSPGVTFTYARDPLERNSGETVSQDGYMWHPPAAATTTYSANNLNQYSSIYVSSGGNFVNRTPAYDLSSSGNMVADPLANFSGATYTWNHKNQLTQVQNNANLATYTYDVFGRRSSKTVNGVTTTYVWDANHLLASYDSQGNEIQHWVYGADAAPVVAEKIGAANATTASTWFHTDALGSVRATTNAAGNIAATVGYSPYGETTSGIAASFQFAGMILDQETGLYYDHARYYSPQQGRFISPDPIGQQGGINIYAYVGNDPINNTDPSGLLAGQVASGAYGLLKSGAQFAYGAGTELLGYALDTGAPELQALGGIGRAAKGLGIGADVFDMAPFPRGVAIEQALGQNLPSAFPTIDNFTGGVATSIKSLDLNAASYQNAGALASRVNGYVDSVANFRGAQYGGVTVNGSDVTSRVLQLAVPNSGTAAQQAALQAASQRAAGLGVQLNIVNLGPRVPVN